MGGLVAYGAYVPYHRLDRARIGEALGSRSGGGTRAVAGYDEDTTSMAVEAARAALVMLPDRRVIRQLFFATAAPAYLDKTNATAVHAALGLPVEAFAADMTGSVRSGVGALTAAAQAPVPTLAVLSDIRTGLPGGADERDGGDGAAAFVFGGANAADGDVIADVLGQASATAEFLERWRTPGAAHSRVWEERFGEEAYAPLVDAAVTDALKRASLTPGGVDRLVVAGLHARAVRRAVKAVTAAGVRAEAVADDLVSRIGNGGTAQPGLLLANALDRAEPGEIILLVVLADGVTATILRTTPSLAGRRRPRPVADQIEAGCADLTYATFLSWRGLLDREPPRRPDPEPVAAPPALRRANWKFAFIAARCTRCGTRTLPPDRVCPECHAVDKVAPEPLADTPATVATYTVDRLAATPSPPLLMVVIDFDGRSPHAGSAGAGRFRCQLTDATEDEVRIGLRVEMTFRRLVTASGIHNYFWKARPIRA